MSCNRDDAAVQRLISHLEKIVLDLLAEHDREHTHTWEKPRPRARAAVARRAPASTTKREGQS